MNKRKGNTSNTIALIFGIVFLFVMVGALLATGIVATEGNAGLHGVILGVSTNLNSFSDLIGLSIALAVVMGLISLGAYKMRGI